MPCSAMEPLLRLGLNGAAPPLPGGSASAYREKELAKVTIKKEDLELIVSRGGSAIGSGASQMSGVAQRGVPDELSQPLPLLHGVVSRLR